LVQKYEEVISHKEEELILKGIRVYLSKKIPFVASNGVKIKIQLHNNAK
tara:strand:+ start:1149 stop:1295 length:147 start_codon:yes stop_codon:yes gene_type:complete